MLAVAGAEAGVVAAEASMAAKGGHDTLTAEKERDKVETKEATTNPQHAPMSHLATSSLSGTLHLALQQWWPAVMANLTATTRTLNAHNAKISAISVVRSGKPLVARDLELLLPWLSVRMLVSSRVLVPRLSLTRRYR